MMGPRAYLSALLLATTLASPPFAAARSLDEIRRSGQLDIGVALFTPWAIIRSDGVPTGFEIEVGARVALDLGVTPAFHLYDWDGLLPALESGKFDEIIAGMTITPERAEQALFTAPYSQTAVDIAISDQVTGEIDSLDDLDRQGIRVGIVRKTLAERVAGERLPRAMRIPFFHSQTLIDALEDGKLDAFLGSEPGPRFAAELNPARIEVPLTEPIVETRQGMAVHKGNLELLAFLNQWVKANRADGWLDEVASHWFDSMRWRRGD